MYEAVLVIHSLLRWIAMIIGIFALVRGLGGWFGNRKWSDADRNRGFYYTIALDIQLLVGLILYLFLSPVTRSALQNPAAIMGNADLRFYVLEHAFYMILAVVFAHLANVLPRRTGQDKAKHKRVTIFLALSLLAMVVGMPWGRPLLPWGG